MLAPCPKVASIACAESPSSVTRSFGPLRRVLARELPPLRAGRRFRHHPAQLFASVGKGRQHFFDVAGHRPGLLRPAWLLTDAYEVDELILPDVVADDEAAIAGPLVDVAVVIVLRQRIGGRQRAPAHRSGIVWTFAAEQAGANRRADAVATDDDVGFGAGAVGESSAPAVPLRDSTAVQRLPRWMMSCGSASESRRCRSLRCMT